MCDCEYVISAKNIRKTYSTPYGAIQVLNGASINVARGEHLAIVGKSGSGKSTILHILGGLDRPEPGNGAEVSICGIDILNCREKIRTWIRAERIGFVFQSYQLLPEMNILENVMLPSMAVRGKKARGARDRAIHLLGQVGLSYRLKHLPCELSGGEQQRAAVARSLMNGPDVILADEPTGNLDSSTGNEIIECLFGMDADGKKPAVVMVTHSEISAARCDRTLRLCNGVLNNCQADSW